MIVLERGHKIGHFQSPHRDVLIPESTSSSLKPITELLASLPLRLMRGAQFVQIVIYISGIPA